MPLEALRHHFPISVANTTKQRHPEVTVSPPGYCLGIRVISVGENSFQFGPKCAPDWTIPRDPNSRIESFGSLFFPVLCAYFRPLCTSCGPTLQIKSFTKFAKRGCSPHSSMSSAVPHGLRDGEVCHSSFHLVICITGSFAFHCVGVLWAASDFLLVLLQFAVQFLGCNLVLKCRS